MKRGIQMAFVVITALTTLSLGACAFTGTGETMSQAEQQGPWPESSASVSNFATD